MGQEKLYMIQESLLDGTGEDNLMGQENLYMVQESLIEWDRRS